MPARTPAMQKTKPVSRRKQIGILWVWNPHAGSAAGGFPRGGAKEAASSCWLGTLSRKSAGCPSFSSGGWTQWAQCMVSKRPNPSSRRFPGIPTMQWAVSRERRPGGLPDFAPIPGLWRTAGPPSLWSACFPVRSAGFPRSHLKANGALPSESKA